jgi:uncharacterized protein (DUF1778 family)
MSNKVNRTERIGIRVDSDMKKAVERLAAAEGRSMSQWMERLVASAIGRKKQPVR